MSNLSPVVERLYRSCPTCEASCGLALDVDRDAQSIVSIKGDSQDHRSRGYVCAKSQAFRYVYEDPERLRRPVKKVADKWVEIDWDQALSEVGEKLQTLRQAHGADSIAMYYGNPNGHNYATQLYTPLFIEMINTQRFFSAGAVDQQPKNLSCELLYGDPWSFPIPDIHRTDFYVCMGGNPLVSQGSIMSAPDARNQLGAIRERGGKVVVLDPRRSETAAIADQHLFIRPGTDAWLLFAWASVLFAENRVHTGRLGAYLDGLEELRDLCLPFTPENTEAKTGVPAQQLRDLIDAFAAADKPVLYGRIGLCTQRFGTVSSWLVDIINILQGRLDEPGGSMFPRAATELPRPATPDASELGRDRFRTRVRGFPEYMNMMPASLMAEELAWAGEDRARALITLAGNPVLSVPNGAAIRSAMEDLELVVALDFYINETTALADYILPSTSQLEHENYDLMFQTTSVRNFARYSPAVFRSGPDTMHQYQIMLELAARMHGINAADLDAAMLEGLIDEVVDKPGFEDTSAETIREVTVPYEGPERVLDILLRAGPYGAGFEAANAEADGLSLKRVAAAEHGIDLGPLEPRLPDMLKTAGQRIRLVHPLIAEDVGRMLAEPQQLATGEFLLIGRRNIRDMNSWLHNINQYVRGKNRCTLLINPQDAKSVGLQPGARALVEGNGVIGEVDIEVSDEVMPGVVSLPHGFGHRYPDTRQTIAREKLPGISANDFVDPLVLDLPSGTSVVNGALVKVRPAE